MASRITKKTSPKHLQIFKKLHQTLQEAKAKGAKKKGEISFEMVKWNSFACIENGDGIMRFMEKIWEFHRYLDNESTLLALLHVAGP
ncbi:hypothetical protein Tco_1266318 [Tanacetum coccineum]